MDEDEYSCILIQDGNFMGMGYLTNKKEQLRSIEILKEHIEPLQDNDFIRNLVYRHATANPEKCVMLG